MDPDALYYRLGKGMVDIFIELEGTVENVDGTEEKEKVDGTEEKEKVDGTEEKVDGLEEEEEATYEGSTRDEEEGIDEGSTEDEEENTDEKNNTKAIHMAGLIVDCSTDSMLIIADAHSFVGTIAVCPIFVEVQGRKILCRPDCIHIEDGIVGIRCNCTGINCTLVQKIEMCDQPVQMSESVHLYDGVQRRLTPGAVTKIERFDRHRFAVNCYQTEFAGYGGLVINKDGMLVGMCFSAKYHLTAKSTCALADTIKAFRDILYNNDNS